MPASIPRRNIVGKEKKSRILTKPCVIEYEGQIVGYGSKELRVETISCWLARTIIQTKHYSRRFV
ncbi:protein mom, partial [Escherichia coli]|nr:protein mom [Salmonella enterica subsp. enterica serovar Montevideo]EFB3292157.1 protein mom [Escherichia coli]EGE6598250.1 protein mom [Escherichia coli]